METNISQPKTTATATAVTTTTSPSPSCTSSPSHEFSFTISFHSSPLPVPKSVLSSSSNATAIDLSPADDIFFHGHLLPLQLLSHPPPPPRRPPPPPTTVPQFSTSQPQIQTPNPNKNNNSNTTPTPPIETNKEKSTSKTISNPFYSLFSGRGKTRKQVEDEDKKKRSFDVGRLLKKYALLLEALFSRGGNKAKRDLSRRPCSFSVNSNWKGREEWIEKRRKRWGQLSAPASMRTSPTNSGLLVATGPNVCGGSSEESTMEELQNAIQAAIAHCKKSISMKEEKIISL